MATQTEEDFKVCGLCSQLVDESVVINDTLRSFLVEFLAVIPVAIPGKICLECYKTAIECKRFREACLKSFAKLEKKSIYSNMILGKNGPEPKKQTGPKSSKQQNKNSTKQADSKSPAGGDALKKKRILESLGLDLDNIDSIEREDRTGRSSRSRGASTTATPTPATTGRRSTSNSTPLPATPSKTQPKSNKKGAKKSAGKVSQENADGTKNCKVFIKKVERERAERYLKEQGVAKSKNDLATPIAKSGPGRKRKSSIEPPPPAVLTPTPPAKKLRKGYAYELEPIVPINGEDQPLVPSSAGKKGPKSQKNTNESRSSFGRERKNVKKTGYVYDENDVIIDEETNNDTTASKGNDNSKNKTPAKANKKSAANEKNNKKNSPSKTPAKNSAKSAAPEPIVEEIDDDDDMEEVFPTIGPYQCEICQVITDTKAEFVAHIKAKHRGIVDEDVLRSLESDIRKAKKKEKVAAKPVKTETEVVKTPTPSAASKNKPQPASAAKKTTPKPAPAAAKSPAKTPAAATKPTPASKKKPGPASKKANPPPKADSNSKGRDAKQKKLQDQEARNAEDPLADDEIAMFAAEVAKSGGGDEAQVVIDNAEEDEEFSSIMETISADQNIKNFVQNGTASDGQNNWSNGTTNAVPQYRPPSYYEKPVTNVEWPW